MIKQVKMELPKDLKLEMDLWKISKECEVWEVFYDGTNEKVMDVINALNEALEWGRRIGTDADTCTGGEASRRYHEARKLMEELGVRI